MTTLPKNARRLALILGSLLAAGPLVTVLTSAARAPAGTVAAPAMVLHGAAVGVVKTIQAGQVLTFAFTETNNGSVVNGDDLVLEKLTGVTGAGVPLCVDADGTGINPDGSRC